MDETYRNRVATILQALYATKYAKEDNVPCQIEEGLFLGSIGVAHNKDILKRFNVTHILIVAKSLEPAFPNDFIYKKIEVLDSPDTNLEQHFDECFNFIDEAKRMGGSVLVHCFAGKSRSVTIIVAYLMKKHHMSLSQALDIVRSKRPQAAPNYGFMLRLQKFEKSLRVECCRGHQVASLGDILRDSFELVWTCPTQANNSAVEEKFFYTSLWPLKKMGRLKRTWMEIVKDRSW